MNPISLFWRKICEPLDGFLWHRDISHPIIRPLLRNQIMAGGASLLLGAVCYAVFPWLFWFGAGLLCITWIFWSWARFFLKFPPGEYSSAFLRAVIFRFLGRLFFLAIALYFAMAVCRAPVSALLAGLISGAILALATYAHALRAG